ncbi:SusD/RagB family nutrient-binding outer membrane lipoprotein [Robertkochia flava]|uniref:SusD/RagB family nutrient-binding outer membrane lipoprotein n=1 Tax=Robertkochia flava TaxID=3447986 RepID=UPI001CCA6D43|nr:SusD/RagB family nutrient-binding outer membrane lipoprotein [Robertkochia marina]
MIKKVLYLFIAAIALTGCDDYLDINENPNAATQPPLKGLLANTTYNSGINVYRVGGTTSYYVQYLASPNEASATDIYERVNTDGTWGGIYDILSDLYDMRTIAEESESVHYAGIAKTLTVLNLGMAVDVYGDVPFSEALNFQTLFPTYDNQEVLYQQMINLLDEAIANFNTENLGEVVPGSNDFLHGGDIEAWKKTAYALKARYLNHLTGMGSYDANAVLNALNSAYTSNDDDAQVESFQNRNPWGQIAVNNAGLILGGWLSEQVIDAMNGTTFGVFDPRLPLITDPLPDGVTYRGTVNGEGRIGDGTVQQECYLTTSGYYSSADSPLLVITYAETKFIEAEAALRAGDPNAAYEAYLAGIGANMDKMGVAVADRDAYLADPAVGVGATNLTLDLIFKEKYVAMFLHPESWVDARRFNYQYTDFTVPTNNALGSEFILRYDYPDTEYLRNPDNVPTVDLTTPIFWDVN